MMSAPSSASRMAIARPRPRAAPVMNATLPRTRSMFVPLFVNGIQSEMGRSPVGLHGVVDDPVVGAGPE